MYIPLNCTMDFTPLQLAPLNAADQNLDMVAESMIMCSKKRKRAAETLDLRELVSHLPFKILRLMLSFSLHTTSPSETLTPWTPSSSSSQYPVSYFSPSPPSPGSTTTPAKRRYIPLLQRFPRPLRTSITSHTSLTTPILLPCHICHRRPSIHSDLASYWACEVCDSQTCYVCMRACKGGGCRSAAAKIGSTLETTGGDTGTPITRGRNICAKCCVEVGAEGRVWCLVCYENEHDRDSRGADESDEEGDDGKLRNLRSGSCVGVEEWLERCGNEPWTGG